MTAIFEVELPDGNILEIEAPANTPPAQIKAKANAYISQSKPKATAPRGGAPMGENQSSRVDKKPVNPAVSYVANQVNDRVMATKAFAHNFAKPFVGAAQFAINQDAKSGGQMAGDMANQMNEWVANNEARYQAEVPDSPASYGGAVVGTVAPFVAGPLAKGMEVAGGMSRIVPSVTQAPGIANSALGLLSRTGQRVIGGGSQGALAGLLMPETSGDWNNKGDQIMTGAVTGGLLPVAVSSGIGAVKGGKYAWENTVAKLFDSTAEKNAANILRNNAARPNSLSVPSPSNIPGVQRTLAEETQDEGIAGLQNVFKNPYLDDVRRDANNTARNQYLEEMTGAGTAYDDAVNFRTANNADAFDQARATKFSTPAPAEKPLIVLPKGVQRPSQEVKPDELSPLLKDLEEVKASFKGGNSEKIVQGYINRIKAAKGNGLVLDNIRRDIDFAMGQKGGDVNIRDLAMIKEKFVGFLKQKPEFEKALTGWATDSKPISRYDIGRAIVAPSSKGAAQDRVGYEVLKPQTFKGRVDNLDTVAQRATGFNRAKAGDYLTPQDMQKLGNVTDDLERQRFADTKGALLGSPTAQRLQANKKLEDTVLSRIPVVGKAFKWLDDIGQEKLKTELALVLQDPVRARTVLAQYPVRERLIMEDAIRRMGWQGVLLGGNTR